jgi:UDP-glucose 4-epimerase
MSQKKLLITGANGFIGYSAVLYFSKQENIKVVATIRGNIIKKTFPPNVDIIYNLDINSENGWLDAMKGVNYVLHCAANYHISKNPFTDNLALCRKINVDGSLLVAKMAKSCGVVRFVYLSSIKVHGEKNHLNQAFLESDILLPQYAYGISKKESEEQLFSLLSDTNMELVIIRPPPVYGPSVPANFLAMLHCIYWRIPLPLKNIDCKRSYVAIDNLLEIIRLALIHKNAAGEVFLVSDDHDLSIAELITYISNSMNKPPLLFTIPLLFLKSVGNVMGLGKIIGLLVNKSIVDTKKAQNILGWKPKITVKNALDKTVNSYLISKGVKIWKGL